VQENAADAEASKGCHVADCETGPHRGDVEQERDRHNGDASVSLEWKFQTHDPSIPQSPRTFCSPGARVFATIVERPRGIAWRHTRIAQFHQLVKELGGPPVSR